MDLDRVLEPVRAHLGGSLTDDVAVLVVRRGQPAAAAVG